MVQQVVAVQSTGALACALSQPSFIMLLSCFLCLKNLRDNPKYNVVKVKVCKLIKT